MLSLRDIREPGHNVCEMRTAAASGEFSADNVTYLESVDAVTLLRLLTRHGQIELQSCVSAQVILTANQQVGNSWAYVTDLGNPLLRCKKKNRY